MPSANRWIHGVAVCTALESLVPSLSASGSNAVFTLSIAGVSTLNVSRNAFSAGVAAFWPTRDSAALTLAIAPEKVSPAASADPPRYLSNAVANVWKSTLPLETISDTSCVLTPSWSESACRTGTPRLVSWSMSSPCSLPRAITEVKIAPASLKPMPAICAVSPTVFNTCVNCSPGLMPDATALAATVAASSSP